MKSGSGLSEIRSRGCGFGHCNAADSETQQHPNFYIGADSLWRPCVHGRWTPKGARPFRGRTYHSPAQLHGTSRSTVCMQ